MIRYKRYGSKERSKNGIVIYKQIYLCKKGDRRINEKIKVKKSLIILMCGLERMSMRMNAKILSTWELLADGIRCKITRR